MDCYFHVEIKQTSKQYRLQHIADYQLNLDIHKSYRLINTNNIHILFVLNTYYIYYVLIYVITQIAYI